ncbi:AAA family ATPase [Sulfitobacter sp. JB4-11]|uniref:AAA family ATPase n=1 Tax=Sulfitobacter rhodophyticola TaxID=3238304 RepID=UPI0035154EF5
MKRVMIVGGPGSGKSTLARALGRRLDLPVFHMDRIQWMAGWVSRSRDERREMALAVEAQEMWVFEGGFSTTYDNRAARADTIIWLDMPVALQMWRVTKRLFQYWGQERPDMAEGCVEGIHREILPFYRWIWRTRHTRRARVQKLIKGHGAQTRIVHLTRPDEVAALLSELR